MFEQDLSRTTLESFHYSIASLRKIDLRPQLKEIGVPVLGVYGCSDRIVDPDQGKVLEGGATQSQVAYFESSGRFPMLDEPDPFHQTLHKFLDQ